MIHLLSDVFDFCIHLVRLALTLGADALEFALAALGGLASLVLTLGGFALLAALIVIFVRRRRRKAVQSDLLVDENGETFTSFYRRQAE